MTLAELLAKHAAIVDGATRGPWTDWRDLSANESRANGRYLAVHDPEVARAFADVARAVEDVLVAYETGDIVWDAKDVVCMIRPSRDALRTVLATRLEEG